MAIRFAYLFAVAACFSCAPPSTTSGSRHSDVITREEILASKAMNAFDVVSLLRPSFLRSRGQTTINGTDTGYAKVYLDRQLFGDIASLRQLQVGNIREIRYYSAPDATMRFGLGNTSGAIEVVTAAAPDRG